MKTVINGTKGVVSSPGDGFFINDKEYHEAPFDNRWEDLIAVIDQGVGPAALTYEQYRDTGFFMRFFRHNQNDNIFMTYQMPHAWNTNTDVYPHAHIIPMASGSGEVVFNFAYAWSQVDQILEGAVGWTSGSVSASYIAADQYKQKIMSFGPITPAVQPHESDILIFKVERPAGGTYNTGKDHSTASANVGILFFDIHYQCIKAGTIIQGGDG